MLQNSHWKEELMSVVGGFSGEKIHFEFFFLVYVCIHVNITILFPARFGSPLHLQIMCFFVSPEY